MTASRTTINPAKPLHRLGLVLSLLTATVLCSGCCGLGEALRPHTRLYIAPSGDDSNSGTRACPLATLEGARDAVRRLKSSGGPAGDVTVYVKQGTYYRSATFVLEAEDSGTAASPIRYCALGESEVRLVGGVQIPSDWFQPVSDDVMLNRMPPESRHMVRQVDLKLHGITDYGQEGGLNGGLALFCDNERLPLARWPNSGWAEARSVKVEGLDETAAESLANTDGLGNVLRIRWEGKAPRAWQDARNVWIRGIWQQVYWQEAWHPQAFAAESATLTMEFTVFPGMREWRRFYAANVIEEIDMPGEWYLDRVTGMLYILPVETAAPLYASLLEPPMVAMSDVSNVVLDGLSFEIMRGLAISVSGGTNVRIQNCTIRHAGQGIHFTGGTNNGVARSKIYDLDAMGILLSSGDRCALTPGRLYAEDNEIHHFGQLLMNWQPGVKVTGVGNRVSHNHIYHGPQYAVHYEGNDHVFEYNHIHDVCLEMSDVGVIGCGTDWTYRGNVIRFNFIHDVPEGAYPGVVCVYFDNCASSATVFGNVFYRVPKAVMIGGGRDHVVENNIFVECDTPVYMDNRGLRWAHFRVDGPMYDDLKAVPYDRPPWSTRYPALARILEETPQAPLGNVLVRNVSCRSGWRNPEEVCRAAFAKNIEQPYMQVADNFVTDEDPGFVNAAHLNFQLKDDSVVYKRVPGFQRIPFEKIGPRQGHTHATWPVTK